MADLLAEAFRSRPELAEARLQIENSHIGLEGSRNELLPELNVIATAQNAGLAGQLTPTATAAGGNGLLSGTDTAGVGGLGTGLS